MRMRGAVQRRTTWRVLWAVHAVRWDLNRDELQSRAVRLRALKKKNPSDYRQDGMTNHQRGSQQTKPSSAALHFQHRPAAWDSTRGVAAHLLAQRRLV